MAFYINLDRRTDRRAMVEKEFADKGLNVERFKAIEHAYPGIGCTLSHVAVLKLARERGYESVMIFEDDFTFLVSKEEWDELYAELPDPYDVVMICKGIARAGIHFNETFDRVQEVQQAAGYIVHSRFYDRLISRLEEGSQKFIENPHLHWIYINDQYWKALQPVSEWFSFKKNIGRQQSGFSDLANTIVDYDF
jgi:glycosyl transferase family 25